MKQMPDLAAELNFYRGKRVLVTGHTGFKGSWLCHILKLYGAEVYGYALPPEEETNLYQIAEVERGMVSVFGDIRDFTLLRQMFGQSQPEIVLHLAAQPLVREGYRKPRETYEVNVMGTINVLECARESGAVRSLLNVTTDKVYENKEWCWGYREDERLNGQDPYSNSKSCADLLTWSYQRSFFAQSETALSTVRAGNVIGGGDFAQERIIPDCIRAAIAHHDIALRHPQSIRPYQHVLEPLMVYLLIAKRQYEDKAYGGSYNVGPRENDCQRTQDLAELFCKCWGEDLGWYSLSDQEEMPEANYLKLDCAKLTQRFGWQPQWSIETAIQKTIEWTKAYLAGHDMPQVMNDQIQDYLKQSNQ